MRSLHGQNSLVPGKVLAWPFGSKADIAAPPTNVRFSPQKRTLELSRGMSALWCRILNVPMAEVSLQRPSVVAVVGDSRSGIL
jgi:hypothetical protein